MTSERQVFGAAVAQGSERAERSHSCGEPRAGGGDNLPVLRLHQLPLRFEQR